MKKAGIISLLSLTLLTCYNLNAQNSASVFTQLQSNIPGQGTVRIDQSNDISDLVALHLAQKSRINGVMGYKISVYRGSGQNAQKQAELISANILSKYDNIKPERVYEFPFWKVYVGAFRTKSEALMFLKLISKDYPDDAFIRPSLIPFPD
jgi:hypothetical protein